MKRINKKVARRLYNEGHSVYVVPCKIYPSFTGGWLAPIELNKSRIEEEYAGSPILIELYDFDSRVNNFEFYNCCYELGYYAAYYVEENLQVS